MFKLRPGFQTIKAAFRNRSINSPEPVYCHERLSSHSAQQWNSVEIRKQFLDFFRSHNHTIVPSSSVVPKNDPSLLFVNAGMNQFKNVLLGTEEPSCQRVANSQKCIRAGGKHNDLDEVGHDGRHHTYFEMLGNWSFGDYFQKEACQLAFTLIRDVFRLPKDKLFMTYFGGDPEVGLQPDFACREIWRDLGIEESHIIPLGMDDNFWAMGSEGPCGPCTEIHYSVSGNPKDMLELWNLVFMQFNRTKVGKLEPLLTKHVDTGMGLERIVAVMQEKDSNYDTDLFIPILTQIPKLLGTPEYRSRFRDEDPDGLNASYRILADHARMVTVAIADGVMPSNHNAPFILRKVLRRSAFLCMNKFKVEPLLWAELIHPVVQSLGSAYPEIAEKEQHIKDTVCQDIRKLKVVLEKGTKTFEDMYQKLENKMVLPAENMFELYMYKGVPEELIFNFAHSRSMTCDVKGFYLLLEKERQKSREDSKRKQQQRSSASA